MAKSEAVVRYFLSPAAPNLTVKKRDWSCVGPVHSSGRPYPPQIPIFDSDSEVREDRRTEGGDERGGSVNLALPVPLSIQFKLRLSRPDLLHNSFLG